MATARTELATLRNLLREADLILATTELPEGRAVRCRELLRSAVALRTGKREMLALGNIEEDRRNLRA